MLEFKEAHKQDLPFITKVYNYFVENTTATFHTQAVDEHHMQNILPFNHEWYATYVIYFDGVECGYAYLGCFKPRQAYDRSAEVTVYLLPDFLKKGIGMQTLNFIEEKAKRIGLKNLLGNITAENIGSVALFGKAGYEKVAHFKNIGEKFGRVLDVVVFQKEL